MEFYGVLRLITMGLYAAIGIASKSAIGEDD